MIDWRRRGAQVIVVLVLYSALNALLSADGLAGAAGVLLIPTIVVLLYWRTFHS